MDEVCLDDGPSVNFKTATLEITKDREGSEDNCQSLINNGNTTKKLLINNKLSEQIVHSKDVSCIPFENIDVNSFFSDRNEVVERAIKDCREFLGETDIVGNWLLTEISLWDTEKERLVMLTTKHIYSIKYDFISLKMLEYNCVPLAELDTVVVGELIYPASSLAPRLRGWAEGMSYIIHHAVHEKWSLFATCSSLTQFEPRKRCMLGVRFKWNKGVPLPLSKKWNPFAKDIPWLTFASHPLFWHKGNELDKTRFDVEDMHSAVLSLLPEECIVTTGSIIVESYCGIGALVHNKNNLGFFKVRGKVSF